MTIEEFKDFYTEGSFAIRDAEIQFKLEIGEKLQDKTDLELKLYASAIRKHTSFLKTCIEVYKKWPELEKTYTKNKSWSDLVKEAGIQKEKRPRKNLRQVLSERKKKNLDTGKIERALEDDAILSELKGGDDEKKD